MSAEYLLFPYRWTLGYRSNHPVRCPPSPLYGSSGSSTVDTTRQSTQHIEIHYLQSWLFMRLPVTMGDY